MRSDLAEVSARHEQTVKEMRSEVAELKALLIRAYGPVPSLPSVSSVRSLQPQSPQQVISGDTRSPSKRSGSSRSHRKKHRRQLDFRSDDEDGGRYQGLPLTDGEAPNELPSVSVLASRAHASRKRAKEEQDQSEMRRPQVD